MQRLHFSFIRTRFLRQVLPRDYNLGFGGFSAAQDATSTVNSPIDSPVSSGTTDSRPLISWIFNDEGSLAAYHEAYDRFIREWIESGWLTEEISKVHDMILSYVENDPSAFYTTEEFEKAVDTLKTFCSRRAESIRGQLEGTIPSTTQGQRADSSSLIDASGISTADMGKMDNGNNQGGVPGGGYRSEIWIWTAVCAAVLLAAVLIIRKTRDHNS